MTSSGAARWLISVVAWLVPSDMRREWRREWEAELDWCAAEGRGTWHQLRRARGAGRHALWLRSRRWRTGMLWQDIRYGARALRSRPALTVVAILTLALGIGANTAIFSVVHAVLLRDLPYPDTEQLVSIYATHRRYDFDHGVERPEDIQYWIEHAQTTSVIAPIDGGLITVTTGGQPDRIRYSQVPPQFFEAMKVAPMLGRVFSGAEATANERVVVVSHALWSSRLGGSSDLSTMTIDLDGQAWRVIGVMPPAFKFPVEIPLWLPFDLSRTEKSWHLGSVARLKPGVTIPDAQRDFDRMAADLERQNPKARKDRGFNVVGLQADLARRSVDGLAFLQGVVGLVLLIGCANVANLMLAQASARQREFSVRSALGASRLRLIRQLMTESLLLSMAGAAVGIAIAIPGVRALVHAAPPFLLPYPEEIGVNWTVLSFTVVLAAATGLIFGLAPALMSSTPNLTRTLGQGVRTASTGLSLSRRQYFRGGLVALEMALALVLLVGGGLLIRSFAMLSSQPPGFESSGLLTAQISLPPARYATSEARRAFWSRLLSDLSAVPGVSQAVMSNALPFSTWEWQLDFKVEGRADVPNDGAGFREVNAGYFETLGIPVLKGRTLTADDRDGTPLVAFVSDVFVQRHMPDMDPIGHRIKLGRNEPWLTVAGVVASTRHMSLTEELRPEIYVPALQREGQTTMLVALRTKGDPAQLAPALRGVVSQLDAQLPVQTVKTMTQLIAASIAERRFLMMLLALFAGLAVSLAAIGVYGVMSFLVSQGRREIGIRLALGARPAQVQRRLLGQGLRVVAVGAVAGLVASLWLNKLLASQLFAITPNDPLTITAVTVALFAAAAMACWIPARRSSRVDPNESLRES